MLGTPEISFTAKIVPVEESEIEKSCPEVPENDRTPLSSFVAVIVPVDPVLIKSIVGVCSPCLTTNFLLNAIGSLSPVSGYSTIYNIIELTG